MLPCIINDEDLHQYLTDKNKKTILTIGSSLTYGAYVHTSQNYPSWLELCFKSIMMENLHINMNAGFPSYNLDSHLSYLKEKGKKFSPKLHIQFSLADVMDEFYNEDAKFGSKEFRNDQKM